MFGGPEIDFGLGEGKGSVLWIENINDSAGLLQEFKEWFEDTKYKKVWHNYGFDRCLGACILKMLPKINCIIIIIILTITTR